jgi:hypothetical protein
MDSHHSRRFQIPFQADNLIKIIISSGLAAPPQALSATRQRFKPGKMPVDGARSAAKVTTSCRNFLFNTCG